MSSWTIIEKSEGELRVKVDGEKWKSAQEASFNKLSKNVEVPGFRKGQAPKSIVKKYVSDVSVHMDAIESLANTLLREGIEEHNLWPVAQPELDLESVTNEEANLIFKIVNKPEVQLGEYKGLEYKVEDSSASEEDINKEISKFQEKYSDVIEKDGAAENGDIVVIDYVGLKDGVAFDGGTASNYELKLGSNTFIPGFEEKLLGSVKGEERALDLVFPKEYGVEELSGKAVVFNVKVNEVKTVVLPELNDDFAIDLNIPDVDTMEALKSFVKNNIEEERKQANESSALDALLHKVVDNASVDIPEVMVDGEAENLLNDFAQRFAGQNFTLDQFLKATNQTKEQLKEQFKPDALEKVKLRLVLEEIANKENLEVSEEDIDQEIQKISDMYRIDKEQIKTLLSVEDVKYDVKLRKAMDFVKEVASK